MNQPCPRCGSTRLEFGPVQEASDCVWSWAECPDCGFRFRDCYYTLDYLLTPPISDRLDFDDEDY